MTYAVNDSTACPSAMAVKGTLNGATWELPLLWHSQAFPIKDLTVPALRRGPPPPPCPALPQYPEEHTRGKKTNPESSDFPDRELSDVEGDTWPCRWEESKGKSVDVESTLKALGKRAWARFGLARTRWRRTCRAEGLAGGKDGCDT